MAKSKNSFEGRISFIHHQKNYAEIEYTAAGKLRSIKGLIGLDTQKQLKQSGQLKKIHQYVVNDIVRFSIAEVNGKNIAQGISFLYNNALDHIINKAATQNLFKGYLKRLNDKVFIKEQESYLFFQVNLSPWQILPPEKEWEHALIFHLENPHKKDKALAMLQKLQYTPAYQKALKYYKEKSSITARVSHLTAHSIYLHIIDDSITVKLPISFLEKWPALKPGDSLPVTISYMGHNKITIEPQN